MITCLVTQSTIPLFLVRYLVHINYKKLAFFYEWIQAVHDRTSTNTRHRQHKLPQGVPPQ